MRYTVTLGLKARKQLKKLPERVCLIAQLLVEDFKEKGPNPGENVASLQ